MSSDPGEGSFEVRCIGDGPSSSHDVATFEAASLRKEAMSIDGLPAGWEHAEAAIELLRRDMRRAFPGAPDVHLVWERTDNGDVVAFVGTGRDWYNGSGGGLHDWDVPTPGDALRAVAADLQECLVEGMIKHHRDWPECPADRMPAEVDTSGSSPVWRCCRCERPLAEVGWLGA